ncbi:hypothetical protein [Rufibacter immobilis]|uniref:hypothetical protein n=1 Tax=Rufibacter immobilis TaxID=1348778 RepID=UPI0035F0CAA6
MKKRMISLKRLSWAMLLGGALMVGTSACSTGTNEGETNVEESDFKDKSPTENNPQGVSDNSQDDLNTSGTDSTNQAIYDQQEDKLRERNGGSTRPGVGAAAGSNTSTGN